MGNIQSFDIESFSKQTQLSTTEWHSLLDAAGDKTAFYTTFKPVKMRELISNQKQKTESVISKCILALQDLLGPCKHYDPKSAIRIVRILNRFIAFSLCKKEFDRFYWEKRENEDFVAAERILVLLTDLLFFPEVSVPAGVKFSEQNAMLIWSKRSGNKQEQKIGTKSNFFFDLNRIEILKCLIVCLSTTLYKKQPRTKKRVIGAENKWIDFFVSKENKMARTLFYSIANTLCSFENCVNSYFNESFEELYITSLQLLLLCLDYKSFSITENGKIANNKNTNNIFHSCFDEKSFGLFYDGLMFSFELIFERFDPKNVDTAEDILVFDSIILFWTLLTRTNNFLVFYFESDAKRLSLAIINMLNMIVSSTGFRNITYSKIRTPITEYLKVPIGTLNLCAMILLKMSTFRQFCVSLNTIYHQRHYKFSSFKKFDDYRFGDILISLLSQLLVITRNTFKSVSLESGLYVSILGILENISPYLSQIELSSSVSLVLIFEHFLGIYRKSLFETGSEYQRDCLGSILQALSNFVQFQYRGCPHLVYTIVHRKRMFLELQKLNGAQFRLVGFDEKEGKLPNLREKLKTVLVQTLSKKIDLADLEISQNKKLPEKTENAPENLRENDKLEEQKAKINDILENNKSFWENCEALLTILKLIDFLSPKMEKLCEENSSISQDELLIFIERSVIVGILPPIQNMHTKQLKNSSQIINWLNRLIWKTIIDNNLETQFFDFDSVVLFEILKMFE